MGEQKPCSLKRKPWLTGVRRSIRTKDKSGRLETRCEASTLTRLPLIKLYYFSEPQFLYLLNGNNYGIYLTRLSLRLDEAMMQNT